MCETHHTEGTEVPDTELPRKHQFKLHKSHAFGDDNEGNKTGTKKFAEIVDCGAVDSVDTKRQAMRPAIGNKFALIGMHFLDDVMQLFQEGGVCKIRARAGQRLAGKPATFIVRIKNFEIASFDFDNQRQLLGELKLVSVIAGSAVDKVADVNWSGLQPY
jgi:hypothetical protein